MSPPPSLVQRRSADGASPGAPASAGRSALAAWQRERRSRRRRLVVATVLALVALLAAMGWAAASLGAIVVAGPTWPLLALGGGAGCFCLVLWPRSDPDRWARGAAGELATASLLQHLPKRRWVVMHDLALPGSRANVDHLVIGPTGVWVVDTKAYRARVKARGRGVFVGGVPLSTAAVRWETNVVSQVLGVEARPIVAVHAKGFSRRGRRASGVKVVPAARLVSRIPPGPAALAITPPGPCTRAGVPGRTAADPLVGKGKGWAPYHPCERAHRGRGTSSAVTSLGAVAVPGRRWLPVRRSEQTSCASSNRSSPEEFRTISPPNDLRSQSGRPAPSRPSEIDAPHVITPMAMSVPSARARTG